MTFQRWYSRADAIDFLGRQGVSLILRCPYWVGFEMAGAVHKLPLINGNVCGYALYTLMGLPVPRTEGGVRHLKVVR